MVVEVAVFGPVRAVVNQTTVRFASLKSANLLGYLVVHETRPRAPAAVAEDLWPEQDPQRSRKALNTEIWRLRIAFQDVGGEAPLFRDETVLRLAQDCQSDFAAFWADKDASQETAIDDHALTRMETSVEAARSVLMEGCYDDWLLMPREMALAELTRRLSWLMDSCLATERFNRAIRAALRLIEIDPLLEAPHRVIMEAQGRLGNRAAAIRQFNRLKEALQTELGVPPLEETIALHAAIISGAPLFPSSGSMRSPEALEGAVRDLISAEARLRRARRAIAGAARMT